MLVSKSRRKAGRQVRYKDHASSWVSSFACDHLKILIVCRGPIRKEAMDVLSDLGSTYGILLSEKDSVSYPHTLAPELRLISQQSAIHRVPDYTGATSDERKARIAQIIRIAKDNEYTHIFAGYGFMAEDAEFVEAIEKAGVGFIGPASTVHRSAGSKDEAKKLARRLKVSVTPGLDNITAVTLLSKAGGKLAGLKDISAAAGVQCTAAESDLEEYAEAILQAGYARGTPLITLEEIQTETRGRVEQILRENPGKRLRFKYIGGGGGKGQRIIENVGQCDNAVVEVLAESKAMGPADNKNFLIELNIERTRHNEIQLLGNGEWCIALGGRDCSLQMHEQKLLELSITDELFAKEIELARAAGSASFLSVLEKDRATLKLMEAQAEEFGSGVNLNSASTFECIVSDESFFFMEMNTRIQVEHRVTEMVYKLLFVNPEDAKESFEVESLVEAMVLCAAHATRLPRPLRIARYPAGGEVRLNATNDALQPHAGGIIEFWSTPAEREIRDDQGIGLRNPDTGWFMKYNLAGAYDSNIALLVTHGEDRRALLESLSDILRRTELRGLDLRTNRSFHYGMVQFCLGLHPMLKPDTRFVVPYLAAIGSLAREIDSFDLETAFREILRGAATDRSALAAVQEKLTLITRPLELLLANPHVLSGWLIRNRDRAFFIENGHVTWRHNPLRVLSDLYHVLNLDDREIASPAQRIWPHDQDLLARGLRFYADLDRAAGLDTAAPYSEAIRLSTANNSDAYARLDSALRNEQENDLPGKISGATFQAVAAAHRGWQAGLQLLDLPVLLAERSGLFEFTVGPDLKPTVPARFSVTADHKELMRSLEPPPVAAADQIVAYTGGMFYSRETPSSPSYLEKGRHFSAGDPIYIIEVMKMFNKVHAEFAGTVEEVLLNGDLGVVVKKGQPLFRVKPDEVLKIETPEERAGRMNKRTLELMARIRLL